MDTAFSPASFDHKGRRIAYHPLAPLAAVRGAPLEELPYVVRILLESVLRNQTHPAFSPEHVSALARWQPEGNPAEEFPYLPARVLLQDLTGVACVVDLASLRSACVRRGADPALIEPSVPVDLVIDHSVQLDCAGSSDALARNVEKEFARNAERYRFLRWGQKTFSSLRIVPPAVGICHQVNLEFLASAVRTVEQSDGSLLAFPDTLVGTDSHTTQINSLGVLGWGVGGIEAEAAMLGQPIALLPPVVTGVELTGSLPPGATATDLALALTKLLRGAEVVGQFVEYFGPGVATLSLADRAVVSNMAPEYGATTGFFPLDRASPDFLRLTGRGERADLVEAYARKQGLFREDGAPVPRYSRVIPFDLASVVPAIAGPRRPHEFIALGDAAAAFRDLLGKPAKEGGFGVAAEAQNETAVTADGEEMGHGAVAIASITSCTNTANPSLLLAAGLVARKAAARGMKPPKYVKTSLAPGSRVVARYLEKTGLLRDLETIGFAVAGYGCATCIGNSGPLKPAAEEAVKGKNLVACAVLSGNRNFEGRIHALSRANYLASPPLVVAYALAGTMQKDLTREPVGKDRDGKDVFLRDLWPTKEEIASLLPAANDPADYEAAYAALDSYTPEWRDIPAAESPTFAWEDASTYIREAPFLDVPPPEEAIEGARALLSLGDFITTDHISPAGSIALDSPAAAYLRAHGVGEAAFNSYGSRRGNHEVMVRGTFANIRLKNRMASREGGWTRVWPSGEETTVFEAAEAYRADRIPLVVLAGKMYGAGSSRDWAAKGPMLLGVKAVVAESFERIHRSNLVQMGILPLTFRAGENAETLGLDGSEVFDIAPEGGETAVRGGHVVTAHKAHGTDVSFRVTNRIDTPVELAYWRAGGILPYTLRRLLAARGAECAAK
jgi:aconitate hydratase